MSASEEAQRFLEELRAATHKALGTSPVDVDPATTRDLVDRYLRESVRPEDAQDPHYRASFERAGDHHAHGRRDDRMAEVLAEMQDAIEQTVAAQNDGLDLRPFRPLIGHLQTGQLNAVSMRVPGPSRAYLVLFEDQMPLFASKLSKVVAWAIPRTQGDPGQSHFQLSVPDVTERIAADPEVGRRFADLVASYAVTGGVGQAGHHLLPPGYANFAGIMRDSLEYFVLGHEYAHILMGHLDRTPARKGVLPAGEVETLAYSWQQELDADVLGSIMSLNACVAHERIDFSSSFLGVGLFFDALDVMDRAVALLETGDEHSRQIGSHPPADLRTRRLRDALRRTAETDPTSAQEVRAAIGMSEVQGEIVRLLWERARPVLLDLRRSGVRAARTWRTIPKEAAPH